MSARSSSKQLIPGIEQGLLLAALSDPLGAGHATRCLTRISGSIGGRSRELHRELEGLDPTARRSEVAALAQDLRELPAPGLERIHPEWLQGMIDALPAELTPLLRSGWPRSIASRLRWPAAGTSPRLLTSFSRELPRLCAQALAPRSGGAGTREIEEWPYDRLQAALHALGVLLLAALVRNAATLRAPLLARLPGPVRAEVEAALETEPVPLPRHLRPTSACEDLPLELALQALAPAPAQLRTRLAHALPRRLGAALLANRAETATAAELEPLLSLLLRADRQARGGAA